METPVGYGPVIVLTLPHGGDCRTRLIDGRHHGKTEKYLAAFRFLW